MRSASVTAALQATASAMLASAAAATLLGQRQLIHHLPKADLAFISGELISEETTPGLCATARATSAKTPGPLTEQHIQLSGYSLHSHEHHSPAVQEDGTVCWACFPVLRCIWTSPAPCNGLTRVSHRRVLKMHRAACNRQAHKH